MSPPLASLFGRIAALPPLYQSLWALLAALTVVLLVLMRTEWGRRRPKSRYVLLSLVAHLTLICLATTVRFMSAPVGEEAASPIKVRIVMRDPTPPIPDRAEEAPTEPKPPESPPEESTEPPTPVEPRAADEPPLPAPAPPATADPVSEPMEAPALAPAPEPKAMPAPPTESAATETKLPIAPTSAEPLATPPPVEAPVVESPSPTPVATAPPAEAPPPFPDPIEPVTASLPPSAYTARHEAERLKVVEREGGSRATEDAVAAGLAWLASAQSRDGRWDADRWSGGRETRALGHNRRGAGGRADTAVTGLALLAFLGADNTHESGAHAEAVHRGLAYLLDIQASDGGLAGESALFARTYSHSMATFALAEALATTGDSRLEPAVRRAVDFLIARQDIAGGGWRYEPGDEGDMSQMGWVIMALRSAELGGVDVPPTVWSSVERFVRSTRRGPAGGLSCYQPRGPVSRTMTAESLYCRQILGWPTAGSPAADEAVAHLLARLPGQGRANLYYWYYASLALHHHRNSGRGADRAWRAWNEAMSRTLVASQLTDGPAAGSWIPNTLWGGYGGRVYATAMATMCLEVYYRYDANEVARDPWLAVRPRTYR